MTCYICQPKTAQSLTILVEFTPLALQSVFSLTFMFIQWWWSINMEIRCTQDVVLAWIKTLLNILEYSSPSFIAGVCDHAHPR